MATIVDCWSCKNNNGGSGWEDEQDLEMLFVVDESPLLAADSVECLRKENVGRWYRLQKSFCSYLQVNQSRVEQRKCAWNAVVESLMQRHPGSQLPERLISTIRRHFESLPLSYAQAGLDSEQVFMHIRLIEQARLDPQNNPIAIAIQQPRNASRSSNASESSMGSSPSTSPASWDADDESPSEFTVAFASIGVPISKQSISWAFKRAAVTVRQSQVFERKGLFLGMISVLCNREFMQLERMRSILRSAAKKSRLRKLTLGLYGNDHGHSVLTRSGTNATSASTRNHSDVTSRRSSNADLADARISFATNRFSLDLAAGNSLRVRVDAGGNVSGENELLQWSLEPSKLQVEEELFSDYGRGVYGAEKVMLEKLNCWEPREAELEFRIEVLTSLCCATGFTHRNVMPIRGICFQSQNIWLVSELVHEQQGSLREFLMKQQQRVELKTVLRIACDVAEGMQFLHECGIIHSNLNSSNILLDDQAAAVISGLKIAQAFDRRTGNRVPESPSTGAWVAPEVCGADSGSLAITPKTDVYNFGVVLWELVARHSPGNTSCSSKPVIPVNCFPLLKYLMQQCWATNPMDRPDFCDILEIVRTATRDLTR